MVTIDVMPPCIRPGFIDHFIYNLQNIFSSAQLSFSRETILQFTPQPSLTSKQWEVSIKYKVVCQHDVISCNIHSIVPMTLTTHYYYLLLFGIIWDCDTTMWWHPSMTPAHVHTRLSARSSTDHHCVVEFSMLRSHFWSTIIRNWGSGATKTSWELLLILDQSEISVVL